VKFEPARQVPKGSSLAEGRDTREILLNVDRAEAARWSGSIA